MDIDIDVKVECTYRLPCWLFKGGFDIKSLSPCVASHRLREMLQEVYNRDPVAPTFHCMLGPPDAVMTRTLG